MSAQKGNILVPVLAVVTLLALAAAGYLFWQNQQLQHRPLAQDLTPAPTQTPAPFPTKVDETANWKTFTNSSLPFQLKYPSAWHVIDDYPRIYFSHKNLTTDDVRGTPPGPEFPLEISATDNKWHLDYFNNNIRALKNPTDINGKQYARVEKTILDGRTAYKTVQFAEADMASPALTTTINFVHENKVVSLSYPNEHNNPSYDSKIYNQILSTFKFTN